MSIQKKPSNFRLSDDCLYQLRYLSDKLVINKTQVVEHAVKYYYHTYHESMAGNPSPEFPFLKNK